MGRRRSFANGSVGSVTFILCFRHFHVQRATVLFCPRRRPQAGKGSTSLRRPSLGCDRGANTRGGEPIAIPRRPTVCRKQVAQPPSPIFLYKPLVFRKFRAATRCDRQRRRMLRAQLRRLRNGAPNTAERSDVGGGNPREA